MGSKEDFFFKYELLKQVHLLTGMIQQNRKKKVMMQESKLIPKQITQFLEALVFQDVCSPFFPSCFTKTCSINW